MYGQKRLISKRKFRPNTKILEQTKIGHLLQKIINLRRQTSINEHQRHKVPKTCASRFSPKVSKIRFLPKFRRRSYRNKSINNIQRPSDLRKVLKILKHP